MAENYKVYHPYICGCNIDALIKEAKLLGYNLNYAIKTPYYRHCKKDNNQTIVAYYT